MSGRRALLVGLFVVLPALAGCAGDEPSPSEPVRPGSSSAGSPTGGSAGTIAPSPAPTEVRGTSQRWHFHDYWKGNPTITLLEANLTFNATPSGADGLPALSALFALPHGVIVPPETGFLTFNVTWSSDLPLDTGLVNITYKPADSNDFYLGGETGNGIPLVVNTTESNCDVPHRQASAWVFNATAKPGGTPPVLPAKDVKITITATIGRPLFIDPPHLNWWRDGDIIPIVVAAEGEIRSAVTPAGNLTIPGVPAPSAAPAPPNAAALTQSYRVPVDQGRIVPEGTKSIVVMLNWTTEVPDAALALRFMENNYPSEGALELVGESDAGRIYALKVAQAQTDTTYSNRTTWEFRVLPEGEPAAAFEGAFTLVAWASRLEPTATLAMVTAPPA